MGMALSRVPTPWTGNGCPLSVHPLHFTHCHIVCPSSWHQAPVLTLVIKLWCLLIAADVVSVITVNLLQGHAAANSFLHAGVIDECC